MSAHLSLQQVSKTVGTTTILQNVSIDVMPGEFLVVVGPSGCGKSTLMRLIAGLDDLSSGDILLQGKSLKKTPVAKRNMAMVFQSYALYPHMSVYDNMAYSMRLAGVSRSEMDTRIRDTAKLLQLTALLDRKPAELSGGQRQRVAMGRAIVRSPSVFLFDEPLSNLDAKLRTEMRHEIKKLHQKFKTTSIYVTHDQTEAMTMADRIMILNQGSVEQIGTPQEVYFEPKSLFVAGFMGHYPMNFIPSIMDKDQIICETGIAYPVASGRFIDQQELVLGVRPEHIVLARAEDEGACFVKLEFVDDMGADKLIQVICLNSGLRLQIRLNSEDGIPGDRFAVKVLKHKIHIFSKDTGTSQGAL